MITLTIFQPLLDHRPHFLAFYMYRNNSCFLLYINIQLCILVGKKNSDACQTLIMKNKGNNKITELRTILQRESQNS